jgi:hypothetical protein
MNDKREEIIERLVEIAATVPGIHAEGALRNIPPTDNQLPAIVTFDGDEEPAPQQSDHRARPSMAPRIMVMTVTMVIGLIARDGEPNVGSQLNEFRADLISLVLSDAALQAVVGQNGAVRYAGCQVETDMARADAGQMGCAFEVTYVLRPSDLNASA